MPGHQSEHSAVSHWNDRDLLEAWLMIAAPDTPSETDRQVMQELRRRASGKRTVSETTERPRLWSFGSTA